MFNPRHAVRVHGPAKPDIELVICYECGRLSVFEKDQERFWIDFLGEGGAVAKVYLNQRLDEAHIPRHNPDLDQKQIEEWRKKYSKAPASK
jgi:hypothetical protein